MPVTRSRTYLGDIGLEDSNNITGVLFGDEDLGENRTTPTAQINNNTDAFPTLFRPQGYSNMVSLAYFYFCWSQPFTPPIAMHSGMRWAALLCFLQADFTRG